MRVYMIRIAKIGYQYVNIGGIDINREGTGDYLFLFFRTPTEVWMGDGYQVFPENTYFLYQKGMPQRYRKLNGHYINDWIHFDIEPYDNYFENLGIPFQTPMHLHDSRGISEMISDLFMEYFDVGQQHEIIMDQKANVMFHKFSDMYQFSQDNGARLTNYRMKLFEMRKKIQNYEYCPKGVKEIAELLNISTPYLQHIYKEFFGTTITKDIIYGRIEHAVHLLSETEYSVTEIARMCGYENLEHFSRQFKKMKGCPPSGYRR